MRAIVVGAGIGGLAAALGLHKIGVDVDVFESAPEVQALGVGINLLPHATRELDALGVLDALRAHAVEPESLLYCTKRGQEIWREPRGLAAGYPWPQLSVHRGRLQQVLLDALVERIGPGRLHLGARLVATDDTGAGLFADGTRVRADLVIAADGIHSAARRERYPDEGPPQWNGALLWRGVVDTEPVLDGCTMVWAGHPDQKFVAYPIAHLPGGRQTLNFIAELRRPDSDLLARSADWNRRGELNDFLPMFLGWRFEWLDVPAILCAAHETFLFPMVDRDPLPRWTFGRTTLLGDAAHPMYPIGSNGASQAILDACALAGCLCRHKGDIDEALRRYEDARRPATAAIVHANRGLGPELPMKLVEERAPGGFADIAEVISPAEIAQVTGDYRRTAGFALSARLSGRSLLYEPY